MGFYPGLFQYFWSWMYPVWLGKKALYELHEFCAPCDAGTVVGRAQPGLSLAWEKNTVLSEMLTWLAWLCGHLLTVGTLRTVWFVAELCFANGMSRRSWGCSPSHIQNHEHISGCLGACVGLAQGSFCSLGWRWTWWTSLLTVWHKMSCCSSALLQWLNTQDKGREGKPLGFSCFHFTWHLLCPYHCMHGQPFACQGKLCLGWQDCFWTGREFWSGTLLIPPPAFAEGRSFALLSSTAYLGFFCEALSNHCFLCTVKMFGLKCFIFVALKTLFWGTETSAELLWASWLLPDLSVLYVPYMLCSSASRCSEPP